MSADVRVFIKSFFYVGVASAVSTIFSTIFTILGGRTLGPAEYGKFVLIQSVAAILSVPMALGLCQAMLKYTSEKQDIARQRSIISTTYLLVLLCCTVFTFLCVLLSTPLSRIFALSVDDFYISLIFTIIYIFYTVAVTTLRGSGKTLTFAVIDVIWGAIQLTSFLILILKSHSFMTMTYSMLVAYGIIGIMIMVLFVRQVVKVKYDSYWAKVITKYALYATIGGLSFVLYTNLGKILISHYLGPVQVGIFNAYSTASIYVAATIWGVLLLVYFPAASQYRDKSVIYRKINKFVPYFIGLGVPIIILIEFVVLKLYGHNYPINVMWILLFAATAIISSIEGMYSWLLDSVGSSGTKITSITAVSMALVSTGLNLILIPKFHISGAVVSLLATYLISIIIKLIFGKNYFSGKKQEITR